MDIAAAGCSASQHTGLIVDSGFVQRMETLMLYIIIAGLIAIGLVYATYRAPFAANVPRVVHWLLGIGLLCFIYLHGLWSEILWLRSNDQASSLVSMASEHPGDVVLSTVFAAAIAYIYCANRRGLERWLLITAAAVSGAVTALGMLSIYWMFAATPN